MRVEPPVPSQVLAAIREPFAGAPAVDAPVMQPLALLLDLAGEVAVAAPAVE